jgi:2-iminobutanoate/2-iminopropanoate deaminase
MLIRQQEKENMVKFRDPESVHQPLASYSHQIEITGPERWLLLSGQVGMDQDGTLPENPIEQLEVALDNIYLNLQDANMEINDLVKLTFYLVGEMEADKRRQVLSTWLKGHRPCMTLLYVAGLAAPGIKVEIDAIACGAS